MVDEQFRDKLDDSQTVDYNYPFFLIANIYVIMMTAIE